MVKLLGHMENNLKFQYDQRLGYISSCPSNLGAGLTASLKVKLPGLSKDDNQRELAQLCQTYKLNYQRQAGDIVDFSL